jgi:hypothetical protein
MTTILLSVGLTLLSVFFVVSGICVKILFDGQSNQSKKLKSLEDIHDCFQRDFDINMTDIHREIEKEVTILNQNSAEIQRYIDSRYDQMMNKIEKEYVRKDQVLPDAAK